MKNTIAPLLLALLTLITTSALSTPLPHTPCVGILSAMPSERQRLLNELTDKKQVSEDRITFITGYYHKTPIVSAITGIGKVNAAMITTAMILHFHPKKIIFSGTAGGLHPHLTIGGILIQPPSKDDINPNTQKPNATCINTPTYLLNRVKKIYYLIRR